jgi:hypothetical protein
MSQDHTLKIVTNLDRAGIEQRLIEVRKTAQAKGLNELAQLFSDVEGMPRAQMEANVNNALKWISDKPGHGDITALLELVGLNLKNLK